MRRETRGFTLMEMLIALTLGAVLVTLAHETFAAASLAAASLHQRRSDRAAVMNAHRYLATAAASLVVGDRARFDGDTDEVSFFYLPGTAPAADSAEELRIGADGASIVVERHDSTLRAMPARALCIDYLARYGADEAWVRGWHSPAEAPVAIRLRIDLPDSRSDTILLMIGQRG